MTTLTAEDFLAQMEKRKNAFFQLLGSHNQALRDDYVKTIAKSIYDLAVITVKMHPRDGAVSYSVNEGKYSEITKELTPMLDEHGLTIDPSTPRNVIRVYWDPYFYP